MVRLRILIADDHDMVLSGVRATLNSSGVATVVGEANGTDELMALLSTSAKGEFDVLVTDLSMPGGAQTDGFVMMELIRRRYPELPVVVLSMTSNLAIIRMILKIGVLGLVDKNASRTELPRAVQAVASGDRYISANLAQLLADADRDDGALAGKPVTDRENEVLRLMAMGLSVSQIALQLQRSITTISKQKSTAMKRLSLKNDQELYDYLRQSGFP